jgi:PAS domain S-box-containing protein
VSGALDVDDLPDGIVALDGRGRITLVNRVASDLTGFVSADLVGRPCGEVLNARDRSGSPLLSNGWHPSVRLRGTRRLAEQVVSITRADGSEAFLAVTGTYLRAGAEPPSGLLLCLRSASPQWRAEAAGIEIVQTVGHELRSPLTSIKGYTRLMLSRWAQLDDGHKRKMLEQMSNDADRVTRLITDLLDISRLESGRLILRPQLVDLPRLAASVADKVGLAYPDLAAEICFGDGFPQVYADPDKIEQVLSNLLENACKYGSCSGTRIVGSVSAREVVVSVVDRGTGITAEDLPRVFTKFFHRSAGRPTGSGLGLWISRGLIEAHGGRLSAESNVGLGSTFRFTLPLLHTDELQER